jgi:hypothetical protein
MARSTATTAVMNVHAELDEELPEKKRICNECVGEPDGHIIEIGQSKPDFAYG